MKLVPCPFCGWETIYESRNSNLPDLKPGQFLTFFKCGNVLCGAVVSFAHADQAKAALRYNKRAPVMPT